MGCHNFMIQMWIQKDRWKRRWSFSFNRKESQDLFSAVFGVLPCSRSSLRPSSMILHLINSPNSSFYILHPHKAFVERQIVTNRILYNICWFFSNVDFLWKGNKFDILTFCSFTWPEKYETFSEISKEFSIANYPISFLEVNDGIFKSSVSYQS